MEAVFNLLFRSADEKSSSSSSGSSSSSSSSAVRSRENSFQAREYEKLSDDDRLGVLIQPLADVQNAPKGAVVIVGFPYDEGCARNGGRPGAHNGPAVFRKFARVLGTVRNPEFDTKLTGLTICDAGDVARGMELEEAHVALEDMVATLITRGAIPFVIGGSNDQSYPNASGLMQALGPRKPIGVVNIDAHLDVRPLKNGKVHSGSPFRLLLQDTRFNPDPYTEPPSSSSSSSSSSSPSKKRKRRGSTSRYVPFVEFAAQGSQCSYDHSMFVKNNGGQIHWLLKDLRGDGSEQFFSPELLSGSVVTERFLDVLDELATAQMPKGKRRALFCSFDLDAVTGADAPGVSCPGTVGLSAEEAFGICYSAGSQAEVQLMDLSEFNPAVDDYRTGRLVANMFYHFLLGVADRRRGGKRSSSFRVTPKSARKKVVLSPSPGAKRVKR